MSDDGSEMHSVLQALLSDSQTNRMTPMTNSRVIYAARLTKKQSNEKLLQNLVHQTMQEFAERDIKITGFLIVQPWCYVHCIEAKSEDIEEFLVQIMEKLSINFISKESKLLCSLQEIKLNFFTLHSTLFLNIKTQLQNPDPPDELRALESIKEVHGLFEFVSQVIESGSLKAETNRLIMLLETSANVSALLSFKDLLTIEQHTCKIESC